MLMVTDSASLASVDAISGHNVDARSSANAHNLASDMNAGGHAKLIRLDKNQKRENRFWRKQRVKEKKQRKWEEQVRKQQQEEQQDADQAPNGYAISENDTADEQEDDDTADEVDNEYAPEGISSTEHDDENHATEASGDGLGDSGYKAEEDDEQEAVYSRDEDNARVSDDEHHNNGDAVDYEDDGHHSLDEGTRDTTGERNEDTDSNRQYSGRSSVVQERAESAHELGNDSDERHLHEYRGGEVSGEDENEDRLEDGSEGIENGKHNDELKRRPDTEEDQQSNRSAAEDDDDVEVPFESGFTDVEKSAPEVNSTKQEEQRSNHDGYETDDEREKAREDRDDEEQDSAVGGSSEDQAGHDEDNRADTSTVSGDGSLVTDRPPSDWVGPRSVSPYIEQQLTAGGQGGGDPAQEEDAHDSAVERDSVFSADEEAAPAGRGSAAEEETRPDSAVQKRPPSRVSLVYTYASGPKVLSHVELAPESKDERRQSAAEMQAEAASSVNGADDKNEKHVTFEEDVKAASSIRIRRRRTESADEEDGEVKQWKEIRKKNKERRKNRTSNTFRSSSTTGSLMNDKRLIKTGNIGTLVLHGQPQPRWNAYFANARALSNSTIVNTGGPSLTDIIRYQEARRRDAGLQNGSISRRGVANGRRRDDRIRTPPAVAGRKHYRVQTQPYLEEIRDRRLEVDRAVQTDPMLDRPSTPQFVPSKTGADVATQIYEGDLFDFELESAPILEVLVGKTVEQSLLEVMEEEELETLKEHQRRFEERRQAELAEQQRLAERERRHVDEKERRMSQRRAALEQEQETEAKVAASALAQNYLADMVPAVFSNLRQKGFFFNGIERDIETGFMPWLRDAVEQELDKVLTGRDVLDDLILDAVRKRREELERRPSLSSRLPAPPLDDPTVEPEASDAGNDAEDEHEEEGPGEDEEDEDAAEEGTDEDEAPGSAKAGEEAAREPDEDEP